MTSSNPQIETLLQRAEALELPLSPWLGDGDDELSARSRAWETVAERGRLHG
jgi:hypothetical protein